LREPGWEEDGRDDRHYIWIRWRRLGDWTIGSLLPRKESIGCEPDLNGKGDWTVWFWVEERDCKVFEGRRRRQNDS